MASSVLRLVDSVREGRKSSSAWSPCRTQRSTGSPPGRTDSPAARRNQAPRWCRSRMSPRRAPRLGVPFCGAPLGFTHYRWARSGWGSVRCGATDKTAVRSISRCWRIVSLVLAVSTLWRNGWKLFVCNAEGSRWMPCGRIPPGEGDFEQLRLWYQSLDDLRAQKARIEKQVFLELRNLFSLRPDWCSMT